VSNAQITYPKDYLNSKYSKYAAKCEYFKTFGLFNFLLNDS